MESKGFRYEAAQLVLDYGYRTLVEVGVWEGDLSALLYPLADQLILVDPWSVGWNRFPHQSEIYECTMGLPFKNQNELDLMYQQVTAQFPKAVVLRMSSVEAAKSIPDHSVDFVYIDAVHTYEHCKADILAWLPKIRPGGMIAGDDYYKPHNAVSRAVDELFGPQDTDRSWSVMI